MPKDYGRKPGAPVGDYSGPSAHGVGGHYDNPTSSPGAAGGGSYSNQRGSQGAAGGGSYSWKQARSGHSPGGGDYTWAKAERGMEATGDVSMPNAAPMQVNEQVKGSNIASTRPDPYNPVQNGTI